jgi:hypothetical protein
MGCKTGLWSLSLRRVRLNRGNEMENEGLRASRTTVRSSRIWLQTRWISSRRRSILACCVVDNIWDPGDDVNKWVASWNSEPFLWLSTPLEICISIYFGMISFCKRDRSFVLFDIPWGMASAEIVPDMLAIAEKRMATWENFILVAIILDIVYSGLLILSESEEIGELRMIWIYWSGDFKLGMMAATLYLQIWLLLLLT